VSCRQCLVSLYKTLTISGISLQFPAIICQMCNGGGTIICTCISAVVEIDFSSISSASIPLSNCQEEEWVVAFAVMWPFLNLFKKVGWTIRPMASNVALKSRWIFISQDSRFISQHSRWWPYRPHPSQVLDLGSSSNHPVIWHRIVDMASYVQHLISFQTIRNLKRCDCWSLITSSMIVPVIKLVHGLLHL